MSDSHQAIYDAARSRINPCDTSSVIERAAREAFDLGHVRAILQQEIAVTAYEMQRPSVLFRPTVEQDGNAWLAIYGALPSGVVGTGSTPAEATANFDVAWWKGHAAAVAAAEAIRAKSEPQS